MLSGHTSFAEPQPPPFSVIDHDLGQSPTRGRKRRLADSEPVDRAIAPRRMVGVSPTMRRLKRQIALYGRSEAPVLLHGETGAGKELTAYAVHRCSRRASGPFVPLNCGAIPRALIESELFGSVPGGYTGARRREGYFVQAHQGTLFLDEIGDLPPSAQVVLLRVLETGEVRPVGGDRARRVDLRIVCATHRDLRQMVASGAFRADLYHRLATLIVELPPLRARVSDIAGLADALVRDAARRLTEGAWQALVEHPWPGNVRELRNVLVRAEAEHPTGPIDVDALRFDPPPGPAAAADDLTEAALKPLRHHMADYVRQAVARCEGNVRAAARALETSPTTVYRYLAMEGE